MNYPKASEAEQRKQERLANLNKTGKVVFEFKFLTIQEIVDEDKLLVEEIHKVKPEDTLIIHKIEKIMLPGKISQEGFLALGENLYTVYKTDHDTLERLGVTYDQVATKLEEVIKAGKEHSLEQSKFGNLTITPNPSFGWQYCPFGCTEELMEIGRNKEDTTGSYEFTVVNEDTGEKLFFSDLHPHLIRDHHFFEGHTKYRLDPEQCIRVLNINPNPDRS